MRTTFLFMFLICTSINLSAQLIDSLLFDIYLPSKLVGRGILYGQVSKPATDNVQFIFTSWGEDDQPRQLLYNGVRILFADDTRRTLFPLIIKVIRYDDEYLYLAVDEDIRTVTKTKYLKVRKEDIALTGYRYLSLNELIDVYKKNPIIVQNVVGFSLKNSEYNRKEGNYNTYYIKDSDENNASFVPIPLPLNSKPDVKILSRNGYWFRVILHFNFMYYDSDILNRIVYTGGCYASFFDREFIGYWKATTDDMDYPFLILSMLKPICWSSFPKYVDS